MPRAHAVHHLIDPQSVRAIAVRALFPVYIRARHFAVVVELERINIRAVLQQRSRARRRARRNDLTRAQRQISVRVILIIGRVCSVLRRFHRAWHFAVVKVAFPRSAHALLGKCMDLLHCRSAILPNLNNFSCLFQNGHIVSSVQDAGIYIPIWHATNFKPPFLHMICNDKNIA